MYIAVLVVLAGRANCYWLYTSAHRMCCCWDLPHCSTNVCTYKLTLLQGNTTYVYSTAHHIWCTIICKTSCCHWNGLRTYAYTTGVSALVVHITIKTWVARKTHLALASVSANRARHGLHCWAAVYDGCMVLEYQLETGINFHRQGGGILCTVQAGIWELCNVRTRWEDLTSVYNDVW